jgi:hypothetical protein
MSASTLDAPRLYGKCLAAAILVDLLFSSVSQNIRKVGLNITVHRSVASTVSITTSLLCLATSLFGVGQDQFA